MDRKIVPGAAFANKAILVQSEPKKAGMKMMNTDFKLQLPWAPLNVSASSIVDSHSSCFRTVSATQGLHGRHVERASVAEFVQFIPRDLEPDAALSMPVKQPIAENGGTEDALRSGDWRLLAERASKEMDPDKLMSLVDELNRALDESQRKRHPSGKLS